VDPERERLGHTRRRHADGGRRQQERHISTARYPATGNLVKEGSGVQELDGTSSYTGDTTINAGTLRLVKGFRYYRFTPTQLKNANMVQSPNCNSSKTDTWLAATSVTNPGGKQPGAETPPNATTTTSIQSWISTSSLSCTTSLPPMRWDEYTGRRPTTSPAAIRTLESGGVSTVDLDHAGRQEGANQIGHGHAIYLGSPGAARRTDGRSPATDERRLHSRPPQR